MSQVRVSFRQNVGVAGRKGSMNYLVCFVFVVL